MSEESESSEWPGLEVAGPNRLLAEVEDLLGSAFAENEMLGSARQTWHAEDPSRGPSDPDACQPDADAPGTLQIWLARGFDVTSARERLAEEIRAANLETGAGALEIRPLVTPNEDWATSWRDFFRPIRVSSRVLILPAWWDVAKSEARPGEEDLFADPTDLHEGPRPDIVLRIEPGQAFGSGTHATTRLTLRALEKALRPGMAVLDFGAGSGILGFAALELGASSVVAVEIDPVCAENFRENARLNGLEGRIDYRIGSAEKVRAEERFDLVLCNVLLERVADRLPALAAHLTPQGRLLLSGFLEEQRTEAEERLRESGLEVVGADGEEEWALSEATPERP